MEVKPGYKRTEVGLIPEEWEVKQIADIANVGSGGTPSRENSRYWDGDIPWVTTAQLDFKVIHEADQKITREGLANSAARVLPPGTILMAMYGQGKTRGKVGILGIEAATNQACASIDISGDMLRDFVFRFLESRYDEIRNLSNSGSQENLSGQIVRAIPVVCPPLPEQRAIATALSDVDALLTQLDRLIAKTRDIKQAAMQQLLTGKTRLPGFGGEWQVKRLGEHATFLRNGVHSRAELTEEGSVKYLHYGDIHTSPRVRLDPAVTAMPCLPAHKAATLDRLRTGDLVFADASEDMDGVGKSVEIGTIDDGSELVSGLHTIAARFDRSILADGFKAYLQFCPAFRSQLYRLAAGTKVYATTRNHIASIEIALPCLEEQTAIATLLSDLDAELAALEARRDKTSALKQGMMQELLTGRTRLT